MLRSAWLEGRFPQSFLVVERLPVGAKPPLCFRLPLGEGGSDLHLVEPASARHGILIGQDMSRRAKTSLEAKQTQVAGQRESPAIGMRRKGDADQGDPIEDGRHPVCLRRVLHVERCAVRKSGRAGFIVPDQKISGPVIRLKSVVPDEDVPLSMRVPRRRRTFSGVLHGLWFLGRVLRPNHEVTPSLPPQYPDRALT